ncbi:nitroreductase family protein [Mumia quercus]|uniref:nitroreductase family protein n=1 Tax=Mumia quercus TaxID=2976125 RepID=UPI0021CEDC2F|nr:nitroreductase family protein [Mumia quercus]
MKMNSSRPRQFGKKQLQRVRLRYLAHKDISRFSRTASFSVFDDGYEQVVSRIMYNVHALEKGLARNSDVRLGFGRKALSNLNDALVVYRSRGYDTAAFAYVEGLSIIRRYEEYHRKQEFDVPFLSEVIDDELRRTDRPAEAAGTKTVRRSDKENNCDKTFYDLAQGRSSVREFSGRPIDTEKVMNALRNAEKTPSVCNRQGWRAYWTEDKQLAAQVLAHQRGFGYAEMPEVLLAITVSNNTFLSPVERNEAFVDGGLFAMSVLYGLEHEGLAAVPLNAMMYYRDQLAVRRLLDIDDSEMIIMFIAVGEFPPESVVPISDRKPAETFVRRR